METLVLVVHIIVALLMIGLILIQQGKGADTGASFGAGASATVFGASGSANFLTKSTAALITVFFITSVTLAIFAKNHTKAVFNFPVSPAQSAPAANSPPQVVTPNTNTPAQASKVPVNPVN